MEANLFSAGLAYGGDVMCCWILLLIFVLQVCCKGDLANIIANLIACLIICIRLFFSLALPLATFCTVLPSRHKKGGEKFIGLSYYRL